MDKSPKGLRRHIALLGRRNVGKSSLLNALAGQESAIVSPIAGTTTDPVEKTLEIKGLGPVVLVDTAGIDDVGELGQMRVARSMDILRRMDMAILAFEGDNWGQPEEKLAEALRKWHVPFLVVRNKADKPAPGANAQLPFPVLEVSAKNGQGMAALVEGLAALEAEANSAATPLLADLLPANGFALLVAPQDSGAPQGRLILPQQQAIRDCLDHAKICIVCTEKHYVQALEKLAHKPDLVVCDSQVVKAVAAQTPENIPLTTFSILMARFKGELAGLAKGAAALKKLRPGDKILVQEACSHHPQHEDIGRVKIPAMLRKMAGGDLDISFSAGKEFREYDPRLKAVIHCGACVITRKQMLERQNAAANAGVPMTNYGVAISLAQDVLPRTLAIFPEIAALVKDQLK